MTIVSLADATDHTRFGGKATELGAAIRAGLPVPAGVAVSHDLVEAIATDRVDPARLTSDLQDLDGAYVVRSTGVEEDSDAVSFAGQHHTAVNILDVEDVVTAVEAVYASAHKQVVREYRSAMGIEGPPRMAAIVQTLVPADTAGVLFTKNPVGGTDERVIEAAWGLGEAVVDSVVTPDYYRVARGGELLDYRIGSKERQILPSDAGGTVSESVPAADRQRRCLSSADLEALDRLATHCEAYRDGGHDIEWAIADDEVYLLQRRDITTEG